MGRVLLWLLHQLCGKHFRKRLLYLLQESCKIMRRSAVMLVCLICGVSRFVWSGTTWWNFLGWPLLICHTPICSQVCIGCPLPPLQILLHYILPPMATANNFSAIRWAKSKAFSLHFVQESVLLLTSLLPIPSCFPSLTNITNELLLICENQTWV